MRKILPIILLAVLLIAGLWIALRCRPPARPSWEGVEMAVHCIDAGPGDCTFIRTPDGRNILVDAGDSESAESVVRYLQGRGVGCIDLLVITHPHSHAVGGLPALLDGFGVSCVLDVGWRSGDEAYQESISRIRERRIDYRRIDQDPIPIASKSVQMQFFRVQSATSGSDSSLDNGSIVGLLRFGEIGMLLPGDIRPGGEADLLASRRDLRCTVLRVARHGRGDSTSNELLEVAKPVYAVIAASADEHGSPSQELLERLDAAGAKVYRTDRDGNIVFRTDGARVYVETQP